MHTSRVLHNWGRIECCNPVRRGRGAKESRRGARMEETTTGMLQKQFEVLKFLGKGSYGSVYKVKRLSDGNTYAIKESNVKNMAQVCSYC